MKAWLTVALLLLSARHLPAQDLGVSFDPPNPLPGQSVDITFPAPLGCAVIPIVGLKQPSAGNGQILLFTSSNAICDPPPGSRPVTVTVGPLQLGTYVVRVFTLPTPITARLAVSRTGAVTDFLLEPASPLAGHPFTLGIDTGCRALFFKPPRVVPSTAGAIVEVEIDPDLIGPPFCPPEPTRIALGPLAVGSHRVRVLSRDGATFKTEAEVAFAAVPDAPALALQQGRFRLWTEWTAPGFGRSFAAGNTLTGESGYFTFASPSNVELVAKVLDGCALNERYWVFLAGLTDLAVSVHVEDTLTGRLRTYTSPAGKAFQPVLDTSALDGCTGLRLQSSSHAEAHVDALVER